MEQPKIIDQSSSTEIASCCIKDFSLRCSFKIANSPQSYTVILREIRVYMEVTYALVQSC